MKFTEQQQEVLKEISRRGRDIVTVECAERWLLSFDLNPYDLKLIFHAEAGIDWGAGAEFYETGEGVSVSSLAYVLADELNAPKIKYTIDFIGAGRRADAATHKAMIRLRLLAGEEVTSCTRCGEYDMENRHEDICSSCFSDECDKQQVAHVRLRNHVPGGTWNDKPVEKTFPDLKEYSVKKGQYHRFCDDIVDTKNWTRGQYTLESALEAAYEWNREDGCIGPVNLVRDTTWDYMFSQAGKEVPA